MLYSLIADRQPSKEHSWNDTDGENPNYSHEACRSATFLITDPT
jgi:hypothetical protein